MIFSGREVYAFSKSDYSLLRSSMSRGTLTRKRRKAGCIKAAQVNPLQSCGE